MRVELLTPAKSSALLTAAQVVARPGFSGASTTVLDLLIAAVSAAAVRYILGSGAGGAERALVAQEYRVSQPGSDRDRLLLPRRPIDPSTVSATIGETELELDTDFFVDSAAGGILYRRSLWPSCARLPAMDGKSNVVTTFWAGYVPPAVAAAWSNRSVTVGEWVLPTNRATSPLTFRVKTAGAMGASEPDWSDFDAGDEVTAGAAVLVAHDLPDAPADLTEGAMFYVQSLYRQQDSPIFRGIVSDTFGPHHIQYASELVDKIPGPTASFWEGLCW